VSAEEFEYSVQGFADAHEEDGDNEMLGRSVPVARQPPEDEEDEQADQGEPFEEFDLGGEGEEGEGDGL